MDTSSSPPRPGRAARSYTRTQVPQGKRQLLDAAAIETMADAQRQTDLRDPPERRVTLIGAIRIVAPLIHTRRAIGWTDAQIVAFLHELGVEISAETLRVYLSRLRRENAEAPLTDIDQIAVSSAEMDSHAAAAPSGSAESSKSPKVAEPMSAADIAAPPPQAASKSERKTTGTLFEPGIDLDEEI